MSMSIKEVIANTFGEVVIGTWDINKDFNLEASISLAAGETGKLIVFLVEDNWHYITSIIGLTEGGSFNNGSFEAINRMFTFIAKEGGILHQTAIAISTICCEICESKAVHDNGLCKTCNERLLVELT